MFTTCFFDSDNLQYDVRVEYVHEMGDEEEGEEDTLEVIGIERAFHDLYPRGWQRWTPPDWFMEDLYKQCWENWDYMPEEKEYDT